MSTDADYHSLVRSDVFDLVPRGGRLLDLGGGTGGTAAALKRLGYVEAAGLVDLVAEHAVSGLDFAYGGDLADPALLAQVGREQGPFDTILALDFLEHIIDPWAMVARAHALLAPGGCLIISVPNIRHYTVSLPLLLGNRWELSDSGILDRTHLRFFVESSAIALATSSGLSLREVQSKITPRRLHRLIDAVTFGRMRSFLTPQYIIKVVDEPHRAAAAPLPLGG